MVKWEQLWYDGWWQRRRAGKNMSQKNSSHYMADDSFVAGNMLKFSTVNYEPILLELKIKYQKYKIRCVNLFSDQFEVRNFWMYLWFIQKNPTKCNSLSKFCYSIFICSSTCFGRHAAHHQEPKTALAASGFVYMEGCWTCGCWTLSGKTWQRPAKPEAASAVLGSWWWAVSCPKHVEPYINME
jgi:hypothetical protein